jgi:metallophosphoesterase superfamily enzyme
VLVRGNHDSRAGDPPPSLGFEIVDEPWPVPDAPGLVACHHPQRAAGGTVLAGHWHPALDLRGPARDHERLPCFCHHDGVLVLPAFGAFTGSSPHPPPAGSTCYPVGGDRVWPGVRVT